MNIIYEDADILVVLKEAGIEAQSSMGLQQDMLSLIRNYRAKNNEDTYVGLIHRLDKPVSGLMVFGKNKISTNGLNTQFRERMMVKKYRCITCGKLVDKCGKLEDYLIKDGKNRIVKVVERNEEGAKKACLKYSLIKSLKVEELFPESRKEDRDKYLSYLEIELETGRFHQIRVQLASRGYAILGDRKYCEEDCYLELAKRAGQKDIMLASYFLEFVHPTKGKKMEFVYEPKGGLWDKFK